MSSRYQVVTLFPELFDVLSVGLLGKAREDGLIGFEIVSPREFTHDKHRSVDDAPYGGGSGMVLRPGPIVDAVEHLDPEHRSRRILLSPQGKPFTQADALRLVREPAILLVCGRYEGFDERIRAEVDEELSLGDFVLLGGEIAALAVIEATARLIPGVLGNEASTEEESHRHGLLEYPQYTRPWEFRDRSVPEILRSGHHAAIARWRRKEALRRTRARRPDLLAPLEHTALDRKRLAEIAAEEREAGADDRETGG
jgi:tRNA (guanine37-N1)-methyltransferase